MSNEYNKDAPIHSQDMVKSGIIAWILLQINGHKLKIPMEELIKLINGKCDISCYGDPDNGEYIIKLNEYDPGTITRWDYENFQEKYKENSKKEMTEEDLRVDIVAEEISNK